MNSSVTFDDLLHLRVGGEQMLAGGGETSVECLTSVAQWEVKAAALRDIYQWTLGDKPAGYDQPLDLCIEGEEDGDGFTKRTVSYTVGPDERITAYILIPNVRGPLPSVITIHPTNSIGREQSIGQEANNYGKSCAYGLHLAQRGYVTISYDLLGAGDRIYPGLKHFDNGPFIAQYPNWSGRGKDLYDLSRTVDVLEQMPEVDVKRMGVMGHSQGGGMATDGMVVEPRLAVAVNNCGDWPLRLTKNPFNRCRTSWWIGQPRLRPFALAGKPMPIDLHEKLALAAPRPVLNMVALDDFGFSPDEQDVTRAMWQNLEAHVKKVYAICGNPKGYQQQLHVKGHAMHDAEREAAYAFLDQHLMEG